MSAKSQGGKPPLSADFETKIIAFKDSEKTKVRLISAASMLGFTKTSELLRHITATWLSWYDQQEKDKKSTELIKPKNQP